MLNVITSLSLNLFSIFRFVLRQKLEKIPNIGSQLDKLKKKDHWQTCLLVSHLICAITR